MTATGLRWRRVLLCIFGALTSALLLLVMGNSAHAYQSFDIFNAANPFRSTVHYWTQGPSHHDQLYTYDGKQYVLYWDEMNEFGNIILKLVRMEAENPEGETISVTPLSAQRLTSPTDRTAVPVLGLSPLDGRLHISWSQQRGVHKYIHSTERCMSEVQLRRCGFSFGIEQTAATQERTISDPLYFNDLAGNLFFGYLSGTDESGTYRLNRYNNNDTWTAIGDIIDGTTGRYDPDGRDGGADSLPEASERTIHVDGIRFGRNRALNIAWAYREWYDETEERPTPDAGLRMHDIYYSYSFDLGQTWGGSTGRIIADVSRADPITIGDSATTMVSSQPSGWYRGPSRMELDGNSQPHIVGPVSDVRTWDPLEASYRQHHIWATMDGAWHATFIERAEQATDVPIVGDLIFDGADDLFYVFARDAYGWQPWNDPAESTPEAQLPTGNFVVTREGLELRPIGSDTAMVTTGILGIPIGSGASHYNRLFITVRNASARTRLRVLWTTDESQRWVYPNRSQGFTIRSRQRGFTEYVFTITDEDWAGTLRQLMFDFSETTPEEAPITVSEARLASFDGRDVPWSFDEGEPRLYAAEAGGDRGWEAWEIYELWSTGRTAFGDVGFGIDENGYSEDGRVDFTTIENDWITGDRELAVHEFDILGDDAVKNWGFAQDVMGWTANEAVTSFGWASDRAAGVLSGTLTAPGPGVISPDNLGLWLGSSQRWLHLRLQNSTESETARVWVKVGSERTFNRARSLTFRVRPNSGYENYVVDMSRISGWTRGTLKQLMILPSDEASVRRGSFKLDRVYIEPN